MKWELFLTLFTGVNSVMVDTFHTNRKDLLDAVESIADRSFYGSCLCFFYPKQNPPDLVFSNLLDRMYKRWTPILPTVIPYGVSFNNNGLVLNFIKCSFVIPIRNDNYTSQLKEILYQPWNTLYRVGDSPFTRFIVVVDGEVSMDGAYEALKTMFRFGDLNVVLVGREKNIVSVFTLFPFGQDGNSCPGDNRELSRLAQWNGKFMEDVDFFPDKSPIVFQRCDFPVSTVHFPPFMFSLGEEKYDGIDYRLLRIISERINVSLRIIFYNRIDGWFWREENEIIYGSLNDLREGLSWATVSGVTNYMLHYPTSLIETSYVYSKFSWYFPNPLPLENWKFVYLAFSRELWISAVGAAFITPLSFFLFAKVTYLEYYFVELERSCFTLWSIAFGNSTGFMPKTDYFRFLFSLWLFFTIHLNLAYTASLTGLITGGRMEPKVRNIDDVIQRNLTTAMTRYMIGPLSDMDDPKILKAFSNYIIVTDYDEILATMVTYRNLSLVDNDVYIDYLIVQNKLPIYQTPLILMRTPTGVMVRRNHFMYDRIDKIVQRLISAGIIDKVVEDFTAPLWKHHEQNDWKPVDINVLAGPFILYACGVFFSFVAFCVEISCFHIKKLF